MRMSYVKCNWFCMPVVEDATDVPFGLRPEQDHSDHPGKLTLGQLGVLREPKANETALDGGPSI
jgi:hypothetical protein